MAGKPTTLTNTGTRRFALGPLSRYVYDAKSGKHVLRENYDDRIIKFDTPADDVIPKGVPRSGRAHELSDDMAKHLKESECFKAIKDEYGLQLVG